MNIKVTYLEYGDTIEYDGNIGVVTYIAYDRLPRITLLSIRILDNNGGTHYFQFYLDERVKILSMVDTSNPARTRNNLSNNIVIMS